MVDKRLMCLGAAFIAIGVLCYAIYDTSGDNYAPVETPLVSMAAQVDELIVDGLFHPMLAVPGQQQIMLPHRYPNVSGGNISSLIHHGMSQLCKPAPQDTAWIERPPGEVAWLCLNLLMSVAIVTGMPEESELKREFPALLPPLLASSAYSPIN